MENGNPTTHQSTIAVKYMENIEVNHQTYPWLNSGDTLFDNLKDNLKHGWSRLKSSERSAEFEINFYGYSHPMTDADSLDYLDWSLRTILEKYVKNYIKTQGSEATVVIRRSGSKITVKIQT